MLPQKVQKSAEIMKINPHLSLAFLRQTKETFTEAINL